MLNTALYRCENRLKGDSCGVTHAHTRTHTPSQLDPETRTGTRPSLTISVTLTNWGSRFSRTHAHARTHTHARTRFCTKDVAL